MRPPKWNNLGPQKMRRIPVNLSDRIDSLLSELDRLGEHRDPSDIMDDIINNLSEIEGGD